MYRALVLSIITLVHALGFVTGLAVFCETAEATITISAVSGDSGHTDLSDSAPTIFGGVAGELDRGGCAGDAGASTTSTCNNCYNNGATDNTRFLPCNTTRINPRLRVVLTVSSDSVDSGTPAITDKDGAALTSDTGSEIEVSGKVTKGQSATISIPWSVLCAEIDKANDNTQGGATCSPTTYFTANFKVGIDKDGTTSDSLAETGDDAKLVSFHVQQKIADADAPADYSVHENCTDANDDSGLCYFEVNPGDEKVTVKNLRASVSFPVSSGIKFKAVRFFFETGEDANPADAFKRINPATGTSTPTGGYFDLGVESSDTSNFVLESDRITGLENEQKYYFKAAVVDQANNVGYFTPDELDTDCTDGSGTCHIARPGLVVGVLEKDVNCFIATAAYGSPMAGQVRTFRKFRNQFLLPTTWGRAFVHTYYKFGPPAARFIAQSDWLRALARVVLTPAWLYAWLSLRVGAWATTALFSLIFIGFIGLIIAVKSSRRRSLSA